MTDAFDRWMAGLEARHVARLRIADISRALRALSSTYVERRTTALAAGRALDGAGKRAAFALYYGPQHFLATKAVLDALAPGWLSAVHWPVIDLGCGTGAAGAAVATRTGATRVHGLDTHPWALGEARTTYAAFGLDSLLTRAGAGRLRRPRAPASIVAAWVVNELEAEERQRLMHTLLDAVGHGSRLLIIEPIARGLTPWWAGWVDAFGPLGARADEWTLHLDLPPLARRLGEAAGLTSAVVKVRTLSVAAAVPHMPSGDPSPASAGADGC